ncbi:POC1 centriolar protein A [Entophlyctis luteolus]|nr:POC1 centriolar protein A [Entophlyctis luteolus]
MDIDYMATDMIDAMVDGIKSSALVVCHLSREYEKSVNCQYELKYAVSCGKEIITVRMDSGPFDRSKFLTGSDYTLYFDLTNPSDIGRKNSVLESLAAEVGKRIDGIKRSSYVPTTKTQSVASEIVDLASPPAYDSVSFLKQASRVQFASKATSDSHKELLLNLKGLLHPVDLSDEIYDLALLRQENTRQWIIDSVHQWALADDRSNLFWLCGVAGCGKSVLAASIVNSKKFTVAASFFCKYDEFKRKDPVNLLCSIAFQVGQQFEFVVPYIISQLAWFDVGYAKALKNFLDEKPEFLTRSTKPSIGTIFQRLIVDPLRSRLSSGVLLLCLDALDECAPDNQKQRVEFLKLLGNLPDQLDPYVKFLITSRPGEDFSIHFRLLNPTVLALDSESNQKDISLFVRERLLDLSWKLSEPESQIPALAKQLSDASGGLFVWAFFAIEELYTSDDVSGSVRKLIENGVDLDEMYRSILIRAYSAVSPDRLHLFQSVARVMISTKESVSLDVLSQLAGLDKGVVQSCLGKISSILSVTDNSIKFMHKSIADFLVSTDRCCGEAAKFCVDACKAGAELLKTCLTILSKWNIDRLSTSSIVSHLCGNDIPDSIDSGTRYSLTHWMAHLLDYEDSICRDSLLAFVDKLGYLGLLAALKCSNPGAIRLILLTDLNKSAKLVNAAEKSGFFKSPLLYEAAKRGDSAVCEVLLDSNACDVNCRGWTPEKSKSVGEMQRTALHAAVVSASLETVILLIDRGADIALVDKDGLTPPQCATGQVDVFFTKRSKERNFEKLCRTMTPLHRYAYSGNTEEFLKCLDSGDNSLDIINSVDGKAVIHYAVESGSFELCQQIILRGCSVNVSDSLGWTPLHYAADSGDLKVLQLLISAGADFRARDSIGRTPLHMTARNNHVAVASVILNLNQATLHDKTTIGFSALHSACLNGNLEISSLFIASGADLNEKSDECSSHLSCKTPLMLAALNGHLRVVKILLDAGADPNVSDNLGKTALSIATRNGDVAIVTALILNGAVNLLAVDDYGWSMLHYAARNGHVDVSSFLIGRGCNVNATDEVGMSPLHVASEMGHAELARLLVMNGADVECMDHLKRTPMHYGAENGHMDVIKFLLDECQANSRGRDVTGQTPSNLALAAGFNEVFDVLK